MNDDLPSAWQFMHPDLSESGAGLVVSLRGGVSMLDGEASIKQSLLLLLSTAPGERVMVPTYGCPLHRLAFSPNDDTTAGIAIHYVRRAVEEWEPRVEILHLDAGRDPQGPPDRLTIYLEYRVVANRRSDSLAFDLSLS